MGGTMELNGGWGLCFHGLATLVGVHNGHDGNNNWLLGLDVVVVRQRQREDVVGLPYLCKQRTHNIIQIHKNVLRD